MPTVAVVTEPFVVTARAVAAAAGLADYPFVAIRHPLAGAADQILREEAEAAVPRVAALLLARPVSPPGVAGAGGPAPGW